MFDLDDIRLKDIEELSGDEKKFVSDSWDKLTKEEQDYYKPVKEDSGGGEFKLSFKSQEEFDTYVAKKAEETIKQQREAAREAKGKAKEKSEDRYFPEGFKAKDWNEAFKVAAPKLRDEIIKEVQGMNQKQRDAISKINQEFDKEFDDLASKNPGLPAKGTKERDDWEAEVADVGVKYKLHTMTDAYDVWKALNSAKGGVGGEPAILRQEGEPAIPQDKSRLVGRISRGTGSSSGAPKTKYYVGQGRRVDDILDQRKREEGIAD